MKKGNIMKKVRLLPNIFCFIKEGEAMKTIRIILVLLVGISVMGIGLSYAQPRIPKESIPIDIPSDMKTYIERLYSSDPIERSNSVYYLGQMGERAVPAIPYLKGILHDNTLIERTVAGGTCVVPLGMEAAIALSEIGGPGVKALIAALKDEDQSVQVRALVVMSEIKDSRAVEPLIAALKDEDSYVREMAAGLLVETKVKDSRLIEPLIAALKDRDPGVHWRAAAALENITGKHFGQNSKKWHKWWEKNKGKFPNDR